MGPRMGHRIFRYQPQLLLHHQRYCRVSCLLGSFCTFGGAMEAVATLWFKSGWASCLRLLLQKSGRAALSVCAPPEEL